MKNDKHLWGFHKDNNNYTKMFNDRGSVASSKKLIYRDKPPVDHFNEFYMKKVWLGRPRFLGTLNLG